MANHSFLELTGTNKIKLKDAYYFDLNTGRIVKEDFSGYTLADQGSTYNKINILAKDSSNNKKLSQELINIGDITTPVFGTSNVTNLDESYNYVTDIKFKSPNLPKTGRAEYSKKYFFSMGFRIQGEKISYSFLEPGASYVGTYNEMTGLISTSDAFKAADKRNF